MSNYNQLNEDNSQSQLPQYNQENNQDPIEIELEGLNSDKKLDPRDYLPDPRIQKKKEALSLQAQKELVEKKNKSEIEMAILKRIIFRIFIFFCYLAFLILGFIAINLYLAYIKQEVTISLPNNLQLNIDTCQLSIYDDSSLGSYMKLNFNIPGTFDFWLGEYSTLDSSTESDDDSDYVTYIYTMRNILTLESCQIELYVGTEALNNIEINCINDAACVIVSYSQNLTINNMTTIKGTEIYFNVHTLKTSAFEFISSSGLAQLNHFNISQDSSINLTTGNIILQSTDSYVLNWTSGVPSYCLSAPVITSDDVTGCDRGNSLYKFLLNI